MTARVRTGCRWVLGLVFLVGGGTKVAHPTAFFADLLGYRVALPEMALRLVALWLPWLEVVAGVGLLLNFWSETVRPLIALLCLVFVVMLGQAVFRGLDLNCGCFGTAGQGWFERPDVAFVRAALLLAAALFVAAERRPN